MEPTYTSDDVIEAVLLDKDELIAALRQQALFWAQQYSDARNEVFKLQQENARFKGLARKAAEIVLAPKRRAS